MTAVANPPSFANINRPAWGNGSQSLNGSINHDDVRAMLAPRKPLQRTNSSSSIASNSSSSSTSTLVSNGSAANGIHGGSGGPGISATGADQPNGFPLTTLRKRPVQKAPWSGNSSNKGVSEGQSDFIRGAAGRQQQMASGPNGVSALHPLPSFGPGQTQMNGANGIMARPPENGTPQPGQPVLYLISLNGTFERKTISVPFSPDTLRIGRQTNKTTLPTTLNGYFDSKVLSRQHAEIWAERNGKIMIRDIKSSNGTFVNGTRLSAENRESEPHELQTGDRLELGIDIVSEDQKSVVHHKVSARVEHAGFINAPSNLIDLNFGDLDPASGAMMGQQMNVMPFRGRTGSQASIGSAGRMAPTANMGAQANGMGFSRGLWSTGSSAEAIVKKIQYEIRNAKQQSEDLRRTQDFLKALLSKDDVRHDSDPARVPHMINGNGIPFRPDPKARFSDPPAPPPQQPLPEKPDVPSLKRGSTERPKNGSVTSTTSPIRPEVLGQVVQLNEALNTAKKEIDTQHTRVRDLEDRLLREQEARRLAEELARKLEETAAAAAAAVASASAAAAEKQHQPVTNGFAKGPATPATVLEETFELSTAREAVGGNTSKEPSSVLESRIEVMAAEMVGLRFQLEEYRKRAEKAEAERDADRETLAEMVQRIRKRDEEDAKRAAAAAAAAAVAASAIASTAASSSGAAATAMANGHTTDGLHSKQTKDVANGILDSESGRFRSLSKTGTTTARTASTVSAAATATNGAAARKASAGAADEDMDFEPGLSRSTTITPATAGTLSKVSPHDRALAAGVPYASMVGVVLLGMGLMAYINGWQPQPRLSH